MGYDAEFHRCWSNGTGVCVEIRGKTGPLAARLLRSFNVIGADTDQSATYDFLLTFHSSHGLSCIVSNIQRYIGQKKLHFFLISSLFNAPAVGVPLNLCNGSGTTVE